MSAGEANVVAPGSRPLTEALLHDIQSEFPKFRLRAKAGDVGSSVIDWALRLVTLGGQRTYLTTYYTVLGSTLYFPPPWRTLNDIDAAILLRHERVHLRQRRRLSFPIMAVIYLFFPVPLGLSYGRARLEWGAYEETIRATAAYRGLDAARALKCHIVGRFTSADYGWMWPFPASVGRWYDRVITELEASMGAPNPALPLNRSPEELS